MKKISIVSFFAGFYLSSTYVHATPRPKEFLTQGDEGDSPLVLNNQKLQHSTIKEQAGILKRELAQAAQEKALKELLTTCEQYNNLHGEADAPSEELLTPHGEADAPSEELLTSHGEADAPSEELLTPHGEADAPSEELLTPHGEADALLKELLTPKISAPSPYKDYKKEIKEWKKEDAQMKYGYSLSGTEAFKQDLEKIGSTLDELENHLDNIENTVSDLEKERECGIFFAELLKEIDELLEESDDQDYAVPQSPPRPVSNDQDYAVPQSPPKPVSNDQDYDVPKPLRPVSNDQDYAVPQSPPKPVSNDQDYAVPQSPPKPVSRNQDYDVPKLLKPVSNNQDYAVPQSPPNHIFWEGARTFSQDLQSIVWPQPLPKNTSSEKTQNSHSKISSPLNPQKNGHYIEQYPALEVTKIAVPKQQFEFKHVVKKLFKRVHNRFKKKTSE